MAGTPTGDPVADTAAAQAAEQSGFAWARPVPTRWSPSPDMTAQTVPANVTVMGTAPGEAPISR